MKNQKLQLYQMHALHFFGVKKILKLVEIKRSLIEKINLF